MTSSPVYRIPLDENPDRDVLIQFHGCQRVPAEGWDMIAETLALWKPVLTKANDDGCPTGRAAGADV